MAKESARAWRLRVAPHFQFLVDEFGMAVIATHAWNWSTSVTYGRDPSAIVVRCSREYMRVEVELVRLVGGKVPPVPIFIHPDTAINQALLDDLLLLRAPSELEELRAQQGLDDAVIDGSLEFLAGALRRHARDFCSGDTAVFSDFDRLIKARVAQSPQKLTLYMPEGTPSEAVDRSVDQARHIDPQVLVEVRFYRRPGRRARRKDSSG